MARVQSVQVTSTGTTSMTTTAKDFTGANFLAAYISCGASETPTISDSKTNTWVASTVRTIGGATKLQVWTCQNPTVDAAQTFTFGQGVSDILLGAVIGLSGRATSSAIEVTPYGVDGSNVTSHTPVSSGGQTTGDDLIFIGSDNNSTTIGSSNTFTAGGSWTLDLNQADGRYTMTGLIMYQNNVGTGSIAASVSGTAATTLGGYILGIKAASSNIAPIAANYYRRRRLSA